MEMKISVEGRRHLVTGKAVFFVVLEDGMHTISIPCHDRFSMQEAYEALADALDMTAVSLIRS
jgi:hypothetical protein